MFLLQKNLLYIFNHYLQCICLILALFLSKKKGVCQCRCIALVLLLKYSQPDLRRGTYPRQVIPLPQSSQTLLCNPPWIYLIHTFYPPYQAPHPFHTVLTNPSKAHINHIRTPNIEPSALALSARRAQLGWRHRSILTPFDSSHNTHRTVHPAFTLRGVPPPLKRIQHSRSLSDLLVFRPSLFGARRGRVKEAEERDSSRG